MNKRVIIYVVLLMLMVFNVFAYIVVVVPSFYMLDIYNNTTEENITSKDIVNNTEKEYEVALKQIKLQITLTTIPFIFNMLVYGGFLYIISERKVKL